MRRPAYVWESAAAAAVVVLMAAPRVRSAGPAPVAPAPSLAVADAQAEFPIGRRSQGPGLDVQGTSVRRVHGKA